MSSVQVLRLLNLLRQAEDMLLEAGIDPDGARIKQDVSTRHGLIVRKRVVGKRQCSLTWIMDVKDGGPESFLYVYSTIGKVESGVKFVFVSAEGARANATVPSLEIRRVKGEQVDKIPGFEREGFVLLREIAQHFLVTASRVS